MSLDASTPPGRSGEDSRDPADHERVLPDGQVPGEALFIPRPGGSAENDGWLLTYVLDRTDNASHLLVLDAADLTGPALASVLLPTRIPLGFHTAWLPADN